MIEDTSASQPTGRAFSLVLGARLREVSRELHGDEGTTIVADLMSIPVRTLENFERGISLPAEILLSFILATGAGPCWLLTGKGIKFTRHRRRRDVMGFRN